MEVAPCRVLAHVGVIGITNDNVQDNINASYIRKRSKKFS